MKLTVGMTGQRFPRDVLIPREVLSEDAVSEREPMHPLDACLLDFLDA
jgi:hypothetical protein